MTIIYSITAKYGGRQCVQIAQPSVWATRQVERAKQKLDVGAARSSAQFGAIQPKNAVHVDFPVKQEKASEKVS